MLLQQIKIGQMKSLKFSLLRETFRLISVTTLFLAWKGPSLGVGPLGLSANCRNLRARPDLTRTPNEEKNVIRIGVLLAQTFPENSSRNAFESGDFYASAFLVAINKINNDSKLLPHQRLEYVYNDTKCLAEETAKVFHYQVCQMNVVGVVGLGCDGCDLLAEYAGAAANVIIISHVRKCL